jgi:hypothetical protein
MLIDTTQGSLVVPQNYIGIRPHIYIGHKNHRDGVIEPSIFVHITMLIDTTPGSLVVPQNSNHRSMQQKEESTMTMN